MFGGIRYHGDDFPGPYCREIQLCRNELNSDTIEPLTGNREIKNGVVFELNSYFRNLAKVVCVIVRLCPEFESAYAASIRHKISRLLETKKKLCSKKKVKGYASVHDLCNQTFVPPISKKTKDPCEERAIGPQQLTTQTPQLSNRTDPQFSTNIPPSTSTPTVNPPVEDGGAPTSKMSYILNGRAPADADDDHSYSIQSGHIKPNEPSPEYMRRFDEIICDFMQDLGVPGAAFSLSHNGKSIYNQGYGIGGGGLPVSAASHFRIASISKLLTAMGVVRLFEERKLFPRTLVFGENGVLSLKNVTVHPGFEFVTVENLLHHSGGWDRDQDEDHVFWYQKDKHRDHINPFDNMSLLSYVLPIAPSFQPGTKHVYSNFGYLLLGLVIEEVTKMEYEDYIHSILAELGVHNLFVGYAKKQHIDYREIDYYNNSDPAVTDSIFPYERNVPPQYGSFPMRNTGPYGGWVTSADNLVMILDSLVMEYETCEHLLRSTSVAMMLKKPKFASKEDAWYGYGLDVEDKHLTFGHTGAMEGTAATVHHNKCGLTWSLLLNAWAKDMDLDGLVKYALSTIPGLPLWHGRHYSHPASELSVTSTDGLQCVRIQLPHSELVTTVAEMKKQGFKVTHINALSLSKQVMFSVVWDKAESVRNLKLCMDVKLRDFTAAVNSLRDDQICISSLEAYVLNGEVCHLFLGEQLTVCPNQLVYCGSGKEEHEKYKKHGYHIKLQSVIEYDDETIISAVYEKPSLQNKSNKILSQRVWIDVPIVNFVDFLGGYSEMHSIDYLQFYSSTEGPKISGVWSTRKRHEVCFQRHDVSKYGFLFELRESMKTNLPVKFVSCYEQEGILYYAAIYGRIVRSHNQGSCSEDIEGPATVPVELTADTAVSDAPVQVDFHFTRSKRSHKKGMKPIKELIIEAYNDSSTQLLPQHQRYNQLFQNVKSELIWRQQRKQRTLNSSIAIEMDIAETDDTHTGLVAQNSEIPEAGHAINAVDTTMNSNTIKMEVEESETTDSIDNQNAFSGCHAIEADVEDINHTNSCVSQETHPRVSNGRVKNDCLPGIKSEVISDNDQSVDTNFNKNPVENLAMEESSMLIPDRMVIYEDGQMEMIKIEVNCDEQEICDSVYDNTIDVADSSPGCRCDMDIGETKFSGTLKFLLNNTSESTCIDDAEHKHFKSMVKNRMDTVDSSVECDCVEGCREVKYSQTQEFIEKTHSLRSAENEFDVT